MYGAVRFGSNPLKARWLSATLQGIALLGIAGCSNFSSSYEMRLASHLSETGAKMYGAYWCPHCATQKKSFGGAASQIPYVECDPDGLNTQASVCQMEEIWAYPTWVIDGDRYVGAQPLFRLAEYSGFEESTEAATSPVQPSEQTGGYSSAP